MAPPVARPGWGPLPAVAPTALLTVEDCVSSMVWLFPSGVSWKSVCVVCGCPRAYGGVWDVLEAVNAPPIPLDGPARCAVSQRGEVKTLGWTAREPFTVQMKVSNMRSPSRMFSVSNYRYPRVPVVRTTDAFCPPLPGPVTVPHGFSHHTSGVASTSGWCEPVGVVTFTGGVNKVRAQMV